MNQDPFKEYRHETEPGKKERYQAWRAAIGLQAVDGLETSSYLLHTAKRHIDGEISIEKVKDLLTSYYEENPTGVKDRTREADIVSARIEEILNEKSFSFTQAQYLSIHKRLFQGILPHAGEFRKYNITKKEWVLNGESVTYGNVYSLRDNLDYDLREEKQFSYKDLSMTEIIHHLARFVARLWQNHIFGEGNTRATAVFFIQYLRSLGFQADNEPFADHSWYFCNALVRANYNDLQHNVHETTEYLERFLRNLLMGERNELHNRTMHISGQWKELQQEDASDTVFPYEDILKENGIRIKTAGHIHMLFEAFGYEQIFGRNDVMDVLGLTSTPASTLIRRMTEMSIVKPVFGFGKGKIRFVRIGKEWR